jgi:hypothetical protein
MIFVKIDVVNRKDYKNREEFWNEDYEEVREMFNRYLMVVKPGSLVY